MGGSPQSAVRAIDAYHAGCICTVLVPVVRAFAVSAALTLRSGDAAHYSVTFLEVVHFRADLSYGACAFVRAGLW